MQIEIFKAGNYRGQTYGKDFIDQVARSYDPAYHEAPAVIGHPKENAPAYGWAKSLKVQGDVLVAELDDSTLDKQFIESVQSGKFKKRSASFYMDLNGKGPYLRHIGFLGAQPPEVKGLRDVQFKEAGAVIEVEMSELSTVGRLFRRMREWLIEKEGLEAADKVLWDWDIQMLESHDAHVNYSDPINRPPAEKESEENDMDEKQVREDERRKAEAEFSERLKATEAENARLKKEREEERRAARRTAVLVFCEKHKATIIPAFQKMGIVEFMERLDDLEDDAGAPRVIEFGEKKEKKTLRAWFESFVQSLPKLVNLSDLGKRGVDAAASSDVERESLIKDFQEKNKVSYKDAAIAVAKQRPDLFEVTTAQQ